MSYELPPEAIDFRSGLLQWASDGLREFPWRDPDGSLYEVFVAEFFLTQTPAENVADVYPDFLKEFSSLADVREAEVDELEAVIEPLGFQRMRAEALDHIASTYEQLPGDPDRLQTLTRVGPYVANATVCFALERRLPIVDRNVIRTYSRVFGEEFPEDASDRERFARAMLPLNGSEARRYNLALLDFGAVICSKLEPSCSTCFARDYCDFYERNRGSEDTT